MWKPSQRLMETISHYASFPATGVSLRQMVQFGDRPSTGRFILRTPVLPAWCGVTVWRDYTPVRQGLADPVTLPKSRHPVPRVAIPVGRTSHSPSASCPGSGRAPRWAQRDAFYQEGAGLVCAVFRGMTHCRSLPARGDPKSHAVFSNVSSRKSSRSLDQL